MKQSITLIKIIALGLATSCTPKTRTNYGNDNNASAMKSVTINQPDLKKEMKTTMKDEDKTKVFATLVYQITINAQKKDAKDDCADGVTATTFDSGVVGIETTTFETIKVKKSCNYLVTMKIGAKSEDGKTIKTPYLVTWDDKSPSILTKEELEKDKPNVAVKLYVTTEGKEFWDAEMIVTPADTDANVDISIAKPFKLTAAAADVKFDAATGALTGAVEITPVAAAPTDTYCSMAIKVELTNDKKETKSVDLFVGTEADRAKSFFKIDANVAAKTNVAGFVGTVAKELAMTKVNSSKLYMYCNADLTLANAKLKDCFVSGTQANWPACEDNAIVR